MSIETHAIDPALRGLLDERAIRDVIHRYARGVDRLDWELVRSCFYADAKLTYGQAQTPEEFIAGASRGLPLYALTQHAVTNITIEVSGDTAHSESYCLARHRTRGTDGAPDSDFLWGGRYVDRHERRAGEWRIASRICIHEWTKIETVEAVWPAAGAFTQGQRSREDVSYR